LAGFIPFYKAWQANRRTSLAHAVLWSAAAWGGWGLAFLVGEPRQLGLVPWRYLALCLTGAAGVAVLGARRPQVGAWNFVVLGLLAVMLLPLGEHLLLGSPALDGVRIFFLGATLAVAIGNYLPTAAWFAAVILGGICTLEFIVLFTGWFDISATFLDILHVCLLTIPWLGLAVWRQRRTSVLKIDDIWLRFRDRFGLFWGQRVRDQYNRSATNAGLPGHLYWHGWENRSSAKSPTEEQAREMEAILRALLQRFGEAKAAATN
jgi:hypothetical protein